MALTPLSRRTRGLILVTLLALAGLMIFANLGDRLLWQDEAEVAFLARTIAVTGEPTAWDGRNIMTQQSGTEFGRDFVWTWSAWGTHELAFLGSRLFGETPLGFRIPSAVAGLLACIAAFFAARRWLRRDDLALLATGLLLLSIPFLLFMRQCRYYSVTCLFSVLLLWAYAGFPRRRDIVLFILFGSALAYFNELSLAACAAPLLVYALIFESDRQRWKALLLTFPVIALIALPQVLQRSQAGGHAQAWHLFTAAEWGTRILKGLFEWNNIVFPVILLGALWVLRRRLSPVTRDLLSLLTCVIIVAPLSIVPFLDPNIRYAVYGIVLASMLAASAIHDLWKVHRTATALVAVILFGTNLLAIGPIVWLGRWFKTENLRFVQELTTHYEGPTERIVAFLETHAKPDDVVLTTYEQLPLMIHTPLRVAAMLPEARAQELGLPRYTWDPLTADWFIARKNHCVDCPPIDAMAFFDAVRGQGATLVPHHLDVADMKYGNSPNITYHAFTSPRSEEGLTIWEIRRPAAAPSPAR